jgi:hypothetical protein
MQLFLNNFSLLGHIGKNMKKLLIFAFSFFALGSAFSQEIDQRLVKRYTTEELSLMRKNEPKKYEMYVYALDHGCYIADLPMGKESELSGTVNVDMTKPLNYIDLGLEIKGSNQYFRIAGTEKMLVLKSEWVLNNELQTKK